MGLIKVDDIIARYKIAGQGTPLLLLHGWGGSSDSFTRLGKILADEYKVVSIDLPGFGETDPPATTWSVEDYKAFVLAFTKRIGLEEPYVLVGHSFGGRIGILMAATEPRRLQKLILVAAAGIHHEDSSQEKHARVVASWGRRIMSLPLVNRVKEPIRYLFYKVIRRQDYYNARGTMKETIQKVIEQDLRPYLADINVPTLIIWGDKDDMTPLKDAYTMEKEIKGSELVVIKGGTHYLPRRNATDLAYHIKRFLQ